MRVNKATTSLALTLVLVTTGCGSDEPSGGDLATSTLSENSATDVGDAVDDGGSTASEDDAVPNATATLPDDFPAELAPPAGATYRTTLTGEQGGRKDWFVVAAIEGDVGDVTADLVSQLESGGFEITSQEEGGIPGGAQSVTLQAESDALTVGISVDNADVEGGVEGAANVTYTVTEK